MTEMIPIKMLLRSLRARDRDDDDVTALAASINEIGLLHPICVRRSLFNTGFYIIVAGHHRHEAVMALGWDEVPCIVVTLDDLHAELAEIDENLIRAQLSPAQEAAAVARRKAIYEELHPETRHGVNQHTRGVADSATPAERFTAATAKSTGKDERRVREIAARGKALGAALNDVVGTSLDKAGELDALARKPAAERAELIRRAKDGETVSARRKPATHEPEDDPADVIDRVRPIVEAASDEEIRKLQVWLSEFVIDRRAAA